MGEIHAGASDPRIIGLRHDVDNVIEPAVELRGTGRPSAATAPPTSSCTRRPTGRTSDLLERSLDLIAGHGHEIGIHNNALAECDCEPAATRA